MYGYHGTDPSNLEGIKQRGLEARHEENLVGHAPRWLHFTTDEQGGQNYGKSLLRFPLPSYHEPNPWGGQDNERAIRHGIPAHRLQIKVNGQWQPLVAHVAKAERRKDLVRVAAVAAFDDHSRLLFGLRGDGRGWCLPGGHFEPGEDPVVAAHRELREETGLVAPHLSYLGAGLGGPERDISIWCFRANDVEGEPDASADPDGEFVEFRWVHPDAIPPEIRGHLRDHPNVVLDLLGADYGEPPHVIKAEPGQYFRSKDGIRIPVNGTPERRAWNRKYLQGVADAFAGGNLGGLRSIKVPLADPSLQGSNMAVNQDRLRLYRRMLSAGDRLPPVVVQRAGQGWKLLDGNHRLEAARALGHSQLHAVEVGVAGGGENE